MGSNSTKSYLSTLRESINTKLFALEDALNASGTPLPHLTDAKPYDFLDSADILPSLSTFTVLQRLRLDLRALDSLLLPTRFKLVEQGMLPYRSACLNAAVTLDVAATIQSLGGTAALTDIAAACNHGKGTNAHKLGRVLRTLAAEFIFVETAPDMFANTRHSIAMTGAGAKSFLGFITDLGMRSATGISADLTNEETRDSFAEQTAPFCKVVGPKQGTNRTFAEYMADPENAKMVELSGEGVVGWLNQLTRASLLNDYPWQELGKATVVDLGAGTGDSGMDVMRKFGGFKWIYQDLAPVIEMLEKGYPKDLEAKVRNGEVSFQVQDYFQPNPVDADVWYMRGVLHEYDDDRIQLLLKHVTAAMRRTPGSRMVINEVLNSSPAIIPPGSMRPPSEHIPDQQSAMPDTGNIMTWSTFSLFGGKERSLCEYRELLEKAGLKIDRLFKFRTFTVMIEAILADG